MALCFSEADGDGEDSVALTLAQAMLALAVVAATALALHWLGSGSERDKDVAKQSPVSGQTRHPQDREMAKVSGQDPEAKAPRAMPDPPASGPGEQPGRSSGGSEAPRNREDDPARLDVAPAAPPQARAPRITSRVAQPKQPGSGSQQSESGPPAGQGPLVIHFTPRYPETWSPLDAAPARDKLDAGGEKSGKAPEGQRQDAVPSPRSRSRVRGPGPDPFSLGTVVSVWDAIDAGSSLAAPDPFLGGLLPRALGTRVAAPAKAPSVPTPPGGCQDTPSKPGGGEGQIRPPASGSQAALAAVQERTNSKCGDRDPRPGGAGLSASCAPSPVQDVGPVPEEGWPWKERELLITSSFSRPPSALIQQLEGAGQESPLPSRRESPQAGLAPRSTCADPEERKTGAVQAPLSPEGVSPGQDLPGTTPGSEPGALAKKLGAGKAWGEPGAADAPAQVNSALNHEGAGFNSSCSASGPSPRARKTMGSPSPVTSPGALLPMGSSSSAPLPTESPASIPSPKAHSLKEPPSSDPPPTGSQALASSPKAVGPTELPSSAPAPSVSPSSALAAMKSSPSAPAPSGSPFSAPTSSGSLSSAPVPSGSPASAPEPLGLPSSVSSPLGSPGPTTLKSPCSALAPTKSPSSSPESLGLLPSTPASLGSPSLAPALIKSPSSAPLSLGLPSSAPESSAPLAFSSSAPIPTKSPSSAPAPLESPSLASAPLGSPSSNPAPTKSPSSARVPSESPPSDSVPLGSSSGLAPTEPPSLAVASRVLTPTETPFLGPSSLPSSIPSSTGPSSSALPSSVPAPSASLSIIPSASQALPSAPQATASVPKSRPPAALPLPGESAQSPSRAEELTADPILAPAPAPGGPPVRALAQGPSGSWGNLISMVLRSHPFPSSAKRQGEAPQTGPVDRSSAAAEPSRSSQTRDLPPGVSAVGTEPQATVRDQPLSAGMETPAATTPSSSRGLNGAPVEEKRPATTEPPRVTRGPSSPPGPPPERKQQEPTVPRETRPEGQPAPRPRKRSICQMADSLAQRAGPAAPPQRESPPGMVTPLTERQLQDSQLMAFLRRPGTWGRAEGPRKPSHPPKDLAGAVAAVRRHLDLGSCVAALAFAQQHGELALAEEVYALMSDNFLLVLGDAPLYRQLSGGDRERILALRKTRGRPVLGLLVLPSVYGVSRSALAGEPQATEVPATPSAGVPRTYLYTFEPGRNAWQPLTLVPEEAPLRGCGLCTMYNYLFLAGGVRGSGPAAVSTNEVFCYNPLTDIWSPVRPMLQARAQLKLVALEGLLYAIGGECLYSMECYDPRTDHWASRASLPEGTFPVAHEAVACRGDIYVTGGHLFYRLLKYSPAQDSWAECPYSASHRRSSDMVALGGFLYRFDLLRGVGAAVMRYNTVTGSWSQAAPLPLPEPLPLRCAVLANTIYCLNQQVTATFTVSEGTAQFEARQLKPFPLGGRGALCPFTLTLPTSSPLQTPL
ncbi:kelch domain-containing protein 7B [Monodelphis domestica]|uniref:Kelch domain containing 7B n=1 Tax=Monodelphis domestica TaxID=13616 RepID=A0A5F8H2L7_MONDO|nr:kelch domain-containing protein 7B [Monodelphis domestica]